MSSIKVGTFITDYSWADRIRPIITINEDESTAHTQLGDGSYGHPVTFELKGVDRNDLIEQLKGLSEIFAKAAEIVSR
jgi:hypothetical protein